MRVARSPGHGEAGLVVGDAEGVRPRDAGAELGGGASKSISSSVGFKSRAECQRSSGFFSRHFRTTRSSARGTPG